MRKIVVALCFFALAGTVARANSCANVDVIGTYDESGLRESRYGIFAAGTFRIAGEENEEKQPMFNLTTVNCKPDAGGSNFECEVQRAVVYASAAKPDPDSPNCSLDLDVSTYSMKQIGSGVLTGMVVNSSACYNSILTVDRNTKRVYMSFTQTRSAGKYDKICGVGPPPTEVLMNCTSWPRIRKGGKTQGRYCDFSGAEAK